MLNPSPSARRLGDIDLLMAASPRAGADGQEAGSRDRRLPGRRRRRRHRRVLAEALRGACSTVLVENKPGASARIAVEYVKNAEPDGSVMLFTPDFPMTL
jgi:hypothetical protein